MAGRGNFKGSGFSYRDVSRELRRDGPGRLYLLHGREDYLLNSFIAELTRACLPDGADDFSFHELDGASLTMQALSESVNALPFGGERTLTLVRGWDINHAKDAELKALEGIISDIPDFATLAFINRGQTEPDGRLKAVKLLRKYARDIDFAEQSGSPLNDWIRRRFAALGKRVGPEACEALVYAGGSLMGALLPEIEKLAAGTPGEEVTAADVERLAFRIPETRAFDMTDRLAERDFDGAARCMSDLVSMGEEPLMILGAVSWQMRRLYALRLAQEEGLGRDFAVSCTGLKSDFAYKKAAASARRFTLEGLRRAVELCVETDYAMKSSGGSAQERLNELLLRLAVECL